MIGRGNRENRGAQVPPILAGSDGIRVTWDSGEPPDPFCERTHPGSHERCTSFGDPSAPAGDPLDVVFDVTRFRAVLGRHARGRAELVSDETGRPRPAPQQIGGSALLP